MAVASFCFWLLSLVCWLGCAYALEFRGFNAWVAVWLASIGVFFSSVGLIAIVLRAHTEDHVKYERVR